MVKMPCLLNSRLSCSSIRQKLERWNNGMKGQAHNSNTPSFHYSLSSLLPRQHPFLPGPDKAYDQQQQKNHHRDESVGGQSGEGNGKWQQKNCFHVEDEK